MRKGHGASHILQSAGTRYESASLLEALFHSKDYVLLFFINIGNDISAGPSGRGLRRGSTAARLLRFWVQIRPWAWIFVCCECCVLWSLSLVQRSPTDCGVSLCVI